MNDFLLGGIAVASIVAGLFFLRFWRATRDRLFALFGTAFFILGVQRLVLAATRTTFEDQAIFYTLRLVAFAIIIFAIVDKNRR